MSDVLVGRELDALIAEKVMGIKRDWHNPSVHENELGYVRCGHCNDIIHHYSTDIKAAWEVVKKMESVLERFKYFSLTGVKGSYRAQFETYAQTFMENGKTPSEAICLAALKAVGCERP